MTVEGRQQERRQRRSSAALPLGSAAARIPLAARQPYDSPTSSGEAAGLWATGVWAAPIGTQGLGALITHHQRTLTTQRHVTLAPALSPRQRHHVTWQAA